MKRCPKCNRTFPDDNQKFCTVDGGLLRATDTLFDPNATIASTPAPRDTPDFGETIASSSSAPTVVFPKDTGPTGSSTSSNVPRTPPPRPSQPPPPVTQAPQFSETVALPRTPAAQSMPPPPVQSAPPPVASTPPQVQSAPLPATAIAPPQKKSKLPLILGILAILLVLGVGGVVAAFFLVIKPRLDQVTPERQVVAENRNENTNANANTNANVSESPKTETAAFVPPPDTTKFTNSDANLDGKLAEHYFDFSFYYPDSWQTDPKAGVSGASNFAKVERRLPPDFTQENFAVGWYTSKGTFADDESTFPQLVESLSANLAKNFPDYRKVSEGPTKVNSLDGYEFRFESVSKGSEKGDIQLWGRVIFLPSGNAGEQNGATLVMLTTSLAPELSGVEDVGVKGQMPVILDSFRFEKR